MTVHTRERDVQPLAAALAAVVIAYVALSMVSLATWALGAGPFLPAASPTLLLSLAATASLVCLPAHRRRGPAVVAVGIAAAALAFRLASEQLDLVQLPRWWSDAFPTFGDARDYALVLVLLALAAAHLTHRRGVVALIHVSAWAFAYLGLVGAFYRSHGGELSGWTLFAAPKALGLAVLVTAMVLDTPEHELMRTQHRRTYRRLVAGATAAVLLPLAMVPLERLVLAARLIDRQMWGSAVLTALSLGMTTLIAAKAYEHVTAAQDRDRLRRTVAERDVELADSERRYRFVAENAGDVISSQGDDDTYTWISPSLTRVLGWSPGDWLGRHPLDLMHPDDVATARAARAEMEAAGLDHLTVEHRMPVADGGWRWVRTHITFQRDATGRIAGAVAVMRDVEGVVRARNELQEQQHALAVALHETAQARTMLQTAMDSSDARYLVVETGADPRAGSCLRVKHANVAAGRHAGLPAADMPGRTLEDVLAPDDVDAVRRLVEGTRETGASGSTQVDHLDEHGAWTGATDHRVTACGAGTFLVTSRDVTDHVARTRELETEREALEQLALHDALTGLPTRALLHRRLREAVRSCTRTAVVFVDLDRFKEINDTLGHAAGDVVLTVVARRLAALAGATGTAARWAGDEFVLVLPDVDATWDPAAFRSRAEATLGRQVLVDGHPVTPRASFGVQVLPGPDGALDTATVLARVDDAMYQQKRARREAERRAAMAAIRLVDPPPDAPTSALVRMAADVCDAESAAVSLADGDRQVFTTRSEFPVDSAPAELTLCRRVVLSDAPLVVPDSREEAALADNPYFGGADGLRFYAGVPLRASGGHTIGALCVVDRSPHTLSEHHVTALQYLADRIVLTLGGEDAG